MNTKLKIFYQLCAILSLAMMFSCGGEAKKEEVAAEEFTEAEKELAEKVEGVLYYIPSPSEIPGLLERTGVEFNGDLLNDSKNAESYTADNDKAALNLGVYSADIGYLVSYEKVQDALNYITDARKLADKLGLSGSFESSMLKRFESNFSNTDSMAIILDRIINNSSEFLRGADRSHQAALLLAGSLVEGLHISCTLIKEYPSDLDEETKNRVLSDLIRVILEQERSVSEMLNLLGTVEDSEAVGQLKEGFISLKGAYESMDIIDKINNNEGESLLQDENLATITEIVGDLRTKIVQ